jgi:hypothetical protein
VTHVRRVIDAISSAIEHPISIGLWGGVALMMLALGAYSVAMDLCLVALVLLQQRQINTLTECTRALVDVAALGAQYLVQQEARR